ncbi:chromosome transmission fidelity factor [Geopyxis carbonaria]|nr:chromosome transmission fidelity factor [Geopyxis carbonaria]
MPDIRSFFTPKGSQGSSQDKNKPGPDSKPKAKPEEKKRPAKIPAKAPTKTPAKKRRVVHDSDEDDDEVKPPKQELKSESSKPTKKEKPEDGSPDLPATGQKRINRTVPVRAPKPKTVKLKDEDDEADDIFAEKFQKKNDDDYKEESQDEDMDDLEPDEEEEEEVKKPTRRNAASRKRKTIPSDEEEDEPPKKVKATSEKKPPAKRTRAPAKKKEEPVEESAEIKKIHDSIPTVRAPTPPTATKKFDFRAAQSRAEPASGGSAELPTGAENCLVGLSFVFTGVLGGISRESGQQLVKRYGGKVMTAPSKKTSYVVLGDEAGPKKLETIHKFGLKTIGEEGLFQLIRTLPPNGGDGNAAREHEAKKALEDKKIKEMVAEMDRTEKAEKAKAARLAAAKAATTKETTETSKVKASLKPEPPKDIAQLWTVKYAPNSMSQICGNKGQVEKLRKWLQDWPKNHKIKFAKRGPDGMAGARAVMIHGPPGIGKTTAAHLIAKLEGYDILEYNASDTRSKKQMEETMRGVLDNTSLMGYFAPDEEKVDMAKKKLVLIMDEVDGMSAGDRGGVGQLAALCKKTSVPIICICNERKLPKMKPFDNATHDLGFKRPDANMIRSRVASIAFREGLKLPVTVIDQLVEGTRADIRQIINMLSTYNTTAKTMTYDESRDMSKAWEKHVILKPWDIAQKLLGYDMFGSNANKTLNQKMELYFNDHEFSYLMVQENYLKQKPDRANAQSGRQRTLKILELADNAAQSISDGDLADAMIHGPQQHWSLMPTHGMFSTVIPSSYMYGGYGGQPMSFTSWLGMNSKQNKLSRFIKEIQSHIRLRISGDRHEVRQQYIPSFFNKLVRRLQIEEKDAISDIIDMMDEYFLTKEDWDAILELGVGPMHEGTVNIPSLTKSAFTRTYNKMSHPMPFMKASAVASMKATKKEVPDIEDAIIESEDEGDTIEAERAAAAEEQDITKDKYVKQAKKAAPKAAAKGKGKAAAEPKATKAKAKASTSKAAAKSKKANN